MRRSISYSLIVLMMVTCWIAGCADSNELSPTPTPTPSITPSPSVTSIPEATDGKHQLDLSVGQKRAYTLKKAGAEIGKSWYEVTIRETLGGTTTYTIVSGLQMTSSCSKSPPTTRSATLRMDQYANPIFYTSDATIGSG